MADQTPGETLYTAYQREFIDVDSRSDWDTVTSSAQAQWESLAKTVGMKNADDSSNQPGSKS